MKTLFLRVAATLLIFAPQCFAAQDRSTCCDIATEFIKEAGCRISGRYGIHFCGEGASMFGGPIQSVSLSFKIKGILSKEQVRKILVTSAQEVLELAKEFPELEACLSEPPFGIKNFHIILFMTNSDGTYLQDPCISVGRMSNGMITYKTYDPDFDHPKTKNWYEETYEEALQVIEQSQNSTAPQLERPASKI